MGEGTWMRYQHDARRHPDGTITVFDTSGVKKDEQSYGLVLDADTSCDESFTGTSHAHPTSSWQPPRATSRCLRTQTCS